MSRRSARDIAFKVLFQVDLVKADPWESMQHMLAERRLGGKDQDFCWYLVQGTLHHLSDIDSCIARYAKDWPLERMATVDRNILRMAAYEIMFSEDVHPVVAIDEAVELAKKYGDENSKSFVNAILDRIRDEKQ